MSDHDAAPDPMDKAYVQAEAVLNDEAERAARRARILAAVASEPAAPAVSAPAERRPFWAPGGWLVAASVAGLSVLVAIEVYRPAPIQQPPAPPKTAAALPATAPEAAASRAPAVRAPAPAPKPAPGGFAAAPLAAPPSSGEPPPVTAVPPPPPPPPPQSARASEPGPAAAAAKAPADSVSEAVVTSERRESRARLAPPAPASAPPSSNQVEELVISKGRRASASSAVAGSYASAPADQAARLRDAAAAGRTSDVKALLARGAPVDAADDEGETALMKAVRADHPAAAALLRRGGASLDLKNRAGASARDMAALIGDADLNRALGLQSIEAAQPPGRPEK